MQEIFSPASLTFKVGISDAQEGDAKYLAPEILNDVIGKSNDIFSLGVTLMELACDLDLPSHGESWQLIRQGRLPDEMIQRKSHYDIHIQNIPDTSLKFLIIVAILQVFHQSCND